MRPATAILLQSVRLLTCLLCMNLAQPLAALAQTNTPAPLPPAAQEAYDKGIMAAREQGYLVAIRYLQEARKLAPQAPQIFRSLGAVEAKIQNRELRAMAWYAAYLAAMPNALDASEVKKEIVRLELKSQISISGLIKQVQDSARKIPHGYDHRNSLEGVVALWANIGDIKAALKTVDFISDEDWVAKGNARKSIAEAQAATADIAGAQKTADLIRNDETKIYAQIGIARIQIKSGDIAGAQKTLASAQETCNLSKDDRKNNWQLAIAYAQVDAGDINGAKNALASAKKQADLFEPPDRKSNAQIDIAKAQLYAGDIAEAQRTLASAIKAASLSQRYMATTGGSDRIIITQQAIAAAQIKAGDVAGAQKTLTAAQETSDFFKDASAWSQISQLDKIITAQTNAGDITGAQKTLASAQQVAAHMPATNPNSSIIEKEVSVLINININAAKGRIVKALEAAADPKSKDSTRPAKSDTAIPVQLTKHVMFVADWLKMLDDDRSLSYWEKDRYPLNTEPFLDLAGYLKSMPPSDNPQTVFKTLHEAAKTIVAAHNYIYKTAKQGADK